MQFKIGDLVRISHTDISVGDIGLIGKVVNYGDSHFRGMNGEVVLPPRYGIEVQFKSQKGNYTIFYHPSWLTLLNKEDGEDGEDIEKPARYNEFDIEVLEMMRILFGKDDVKAFLKLSAFKYRLRAGHKKNTAPEVDIQKAMYCMKRKEEI